MSQFNWTYDADTGTHKNHAISSRLYDAAVEKSVFMDHVQPVEGFGRKMGETVTLMRVSNITEPSAARRTNRPAASAVPALRGPCPEWPPHCRDRCASAR